MAAFWPARMYRPNRRGQTDISKDKIFMIKSKRMMRRNCSVLLPVLSAILLLTCGAGAQTAAKSEVLVIDASAPAHPFPHFWEHMFGSGRANLTLRESYRNDLRQVKKITDLEYVRFHAIFLDDMGVYDEDS